MPRPQIKTGFTDLFGIERPICLAGMSAAAGPGLAAAVTNAGGLGVIGGIRATPAFLRQQIRELKEDLNDKNAPFGVDLLIPAIGGSARKTNKDYTQGKLSELIDVIIEEGTALFVCAVGVPPKEVVDALHAANIPIMNMIGHVKHVKKCIEAGVDIICAQGGEGGGHTGNIPSMLLWPAVAELIKGHKSPLTGKPMQLVAAGGIYDGRGVAAALALGASAVWVGTRFVAAEEAGASPAHQKAVVEAGYDDTVRTLIYSGRPMRVRANDLNRDWEENRQADIKRLTAAGEVPVGMDAVETRPYLMGMVAGAIKAVEPAAVIMDRMIAEASEIMQTNGKLLAKL